MKFKQPLDEIFSQAGKVRVLRHLARVRMEQHGRAVAAELDMSPTACHQILKSLGQVGVVRERRAGGAHFYQLDEDHYVVKEMLLPLFEREHNLLNTALQELASNIGRRALSVVLFGSVARGEERDGSDIDVLIVVADERDKARAHEKFLEHNANWAVRFSHLPIPLIWSREELVSQLERRSNIVKEIIRDGHLICGKQLYEISLEMRRQTTNAKGTRPNGSSKIH